MPDALFELTDLELQPIEDFDLLGDTSARLWAKPGKGCLEADLPAPVKMSLCSVVVMPYSLEPPARAGVARVAWLRFFPQGTETV